MGNSSCHALNNDNLDSMTKKELKQFINKNEQKQINQEQKRKQNIQYWKLYIVNELNQNLNLFAEFEMRSDNATYHDYPIIYNSGYKLKEIKKKNY